MSSGIVKSKPDLFNEAINAEKDTIDAFFSEFIREYLDLIDQFSNRTLDQHTKEVFAQFLKLIIMI